MHRKESAKNIMVVTTYCYLIIKLSLCLPAKPV